MAYRAEIEISVKGQRQLEQLRSTTNLSAKAADSLRDSLAKSGGLNQTLQSYSNILQTTSRTLKNVVFETEGETKAIKEYVTALGQSNEAAARQNRLIEAEVTLRNKAKKSIETRRKRDEFLAGPGRTIGAEKSAQRAAKDSARRQREFKEIETFNAKINRIEANFNQGQARIKRDADNGELDRLLKRLDLEKRKVQEIGQLRADINTKELKDFDRRLKEASTLRGQSSPIGGAANIPGSPAARRRTANRKAFTRGAGIGLASANIPGQSIAQAAAFGAGFGGPKGAAVAAGVAAVSQSIAGLVRLGPEVAKTEAQLSKLSIALRGILGSQSAEGFKAIDRAARDFNQPILDATRNFTQLSAAATANGNSVKQTETLYRALSAATKATGGDAQDLSGVLRAATQVISKGVVRSEELRGQIGDRLPGAFQLFAQATNRSAEELQKALEQGEVSADEFVTTFSNFILNKFEPAALRIGDSPAEAGARLTKALEDANRAAGPLLLALGAKFQDFATEAMQSLLPLLKLINKTFKLDRAGQNQRLADLEKNIIPGLEARSAELFAGDPNDPVYRESGSRLLGKVKTTRGEALRATQKELAAARGEQVQKRAELFPTGALTSLKPTTPTPDDPTGKGKGKADKAAERAAREEERLQQRLAALRVELNLIEDNANFKTQITAAEIAGNKELAIRLKAQQTINTIQANEEKALIRIKDIREINLVKQETAAKINAANVNAAAELAVFEDQKQKAFDEQIESLNFQYEILTATTVEEQKRLKIAQEMAALEGKDFTPEQLDQIKAAKEKLDIGPIANYVNELQRSLSDTESMVVSLAQSVESSLATAMSSAVQSIVTGTGSVQEAFSDMFANIGKAFIDMATQMIAKALVMKALGILTSAFGGGGGGIGFNPSAPSITGNSLGDFGGGSFGGFMANGGPVSANTPYIVGERGPELMVPSTSGMVLSNSETRQQLTQQGSAMRSTEATRQQLNTQRNTMITNSTREMMLSNPDPIDVRYESTVINNVEYVTAEQHRQGMAQAAERGRSLTLSALQGSVKARKKVGLS
ncbi:MAG: tape measure protein [Pontimonas sp.]